MALISTLNNMGYTSPNFDWTQSSFLKNLESAPGIGLDIGCSFGFVCQEALKNGHSIIGMDIDIRHLEFLNNSLTTNYSGSLKTVVGRFPDDLNLAPNSIGSVLISRVIHFLKGKEIESGFNKIYHCLAPNGKLFIETMTPFLPQIYDELTIEGNIREINSDWPGEIQNPQFFKKTFKDQVPDFFNLIDHETLERALVKSGFKIIDYRYYSPIDLSPEGRFDGRESLSMIAIK